MRSPRPGFPFARGRPSDQQILVTAQQKKGSAPSIQLSALSIAEPGEVNDVVGLLTTIGTPDDWGTSTYTIEAGGDPDSKFQIVGDELQLSATLDFETATSHLVTITATPSGPYDPITRQFTIEVTNLIEAPVNLIAPAVTGDLDGILTCSTGTWTDMGAGSFAYQWKDAADDSDLVGETANTLDTADHAGLEVYCTVTATNSADSAAEDSNTVGPVGDLVAPTLSAAFDTATGDTTANVGATTDEAGGTLYAVSSELEPSAAQIKAGQDSTGGAATIAVSQAVSATGVQTIPVTGLTAETAYDPIWFMHEDAAENQSNVVGGDGFTTEAELAIVPAAFEVGDWSVAAGDEEADVTISALPDDGGPEITDVEYRLDGGSWVSSGGTTSFTITGLTNDQEYDVELRAVNSVGAGAASDTKQVTPEAAGGYTFVNAEAEAISNAFTTPADDARKEVIDDLVGALKTAGVWAKTDNLYVLAAAAADQALINWKNPGTFDLTAVNSPAFAADGGYTSDGSTSYLDSGWDAATNGVQYAQDSAHVGSYAMTAGSTAGNDVGTGTSTTSGARARTGTGGRAYVNSTTHSPCSGAVVAPPMHVMGIRRNSANVLAWRDGAQNTSTSATSGALTTDDFNICRANSAFPDRQIGAAHWGAALDDTEAAAYYTALNAYMVAVGADT